MARYGALLPDGAKEKKAFLALSFACLEGRKFELCCSGLRVDAI